MPSSRYYAPPTSIHPVEGVKVRRTDCADVYTGTPEALSASGLLPLSEFPGQPGRPRQNVTYQPREKRYGEGCMMVFRNPGGTFRIELRVSDNEKERRASEKLVAAARRRNPVRAGASKRLTFDDINNQRREPNGLVMEDYSPRFKRYVGSSMQISTAGLLPDSFPGFPKPENSSKGWCSTRWDEGHSQYNLSKQYVSGDAKRREDCTADHWVFDVFDERYRFDDYLDRLGT